MYRLRWLIFCALVMVLIAGCGPKMVTVSSGKKVICSKCDKTIRSDTKLLQVKEEKAAKYSVRETTQICPSCQAKLEAQKREAERRRIEEAARLARQRQIQERGRIAGTWVCRFGGILGDAVVRFNPDGTGQWQTPDAATRWKSTGSDITISVTWVERGQAKRAHCTGQLSDDGSRLLIQGWSAWGFGRSENAVFERM